ncbi:putative mitochondrial carrier (TC 2.A.29) family protein [Lyophyllum shimeji]|uniref:Mitochondrial carrier (TC 2.A.29) family protein n=1 Tax=Lyophyllum shimeji TaxID=47721 RepID=A0A9P3PDB4_LYOSH|nr:putative mitochondrial carrier (TC 2.A.29) family protein [Lyophyllum shimeji]
MERNTRPLTRRELFDASLTGAIERPPIPRLRSDPSPHYSPPHTLQEFREREGRIHRKQRLQDLWRRLPQRAPRDRERKDTECAADAVADDGLTHAKAEKLWAMYGEELLGHCGASPSASMTREIPWRKFKEYAEAKEVELWAIFHDELDLDGNGHLDAQELTLALSKAGIKLSPKTLSEFMTTLTSSPHSHAISFAEFRDFLLLLPRKVSPAEIYQYYEVAKFMGDDGRGPARVTMEGDVFLSAEDKPPETTRPSHAGASDSASTPASRDDEEPEEEDEPFYEDDEESHNWLQARSSLKFLLAGGVAGAVSRTCTAPFDRLKIFLITRPPDLGGTTISAKPSLGGIRSIASAVARIYTEGGVLAFWTGNGLSVAKIFPESAIKFFAYESSKRAFAEYWDKVEDPREISGVSRFLAGGIGGISSQLSIYPIETLKTQMMSNTHEQKRTLIQAARHVWSLGGARAYYRGLTIGLIGVFPYSAIDMSTFEALKLAYLRSTGKEEPGVMELLAFGSISGSVGATSVYPLNLVRTRLQASGSSGHPQRYTGVLDVVIKTWERDGWRGFYRGLFPTLAKVIPSVSISYVVYEHAKRRLGV